MIPINSKLSVAIGLILMYGSVGAIEADTMQLWKAFSFGLIGAVLVIDGAIRMNENSDV